MTRGLLPLFALGFIASTAGAQDVAVQRGVRVQPESVTVGDPFRVTVRVRAPKGTVLEFPQGPDTTTGVEPLDRVVITPGTDTSVVDHVATYRLAAWDVGRLPIRFDDILLRSGGRERRLAVGVLAIEVTSVLPADSAQRVPKPVRPVYEFGVPWWYWLIVALLAAAIGALLWWWWRRRRDPAALRRDPYDEAIHAFDHADSLGLINAGEAGHHLALVAEVLRVYLSRVVPAARTAHTTSELVLALRGDPIVPLPRLARALHDIDLVKFARHPVTEARAGELSTEARAIVVAVHEAQQAAQVARAA
ncbi:MAG: hypothetical protein H7066_04200 [Cytophagaceae bacterium]|nr:hypothetical protein [Gemmatimonadaceae bacterium]